MRRSAKELNKTVTDIDHAPVNANGKVEFSADMVILKPVDLALGAKTLFFEVNNRGRKITFGRMHDTASDANMNDPIQGFRGPSPRLASLYGNLIHDNECYGSMAVYLRLQKLVPPSSQGRGGGNQRVECKILLVLKNSNCM